MRSFSYHVKLLKLGAGQRLREVFTPEEVLDLNAGLMLGGQLSLGLLHLTTQLLHGADVLAHILSSFILVELDEVLHDTLIEVFPAEVSVSISGHHHKDAVIDGQQGNVKCAATEIKHQDVLLTVLLVQTISNRGGSSVESTKMSIRVIINQNH